MNNFSNQNQNQNQQNSQQRTGFNQEQQNNFQQANNQANQPQPSWMMEIAGACLPVLMKKLTGQDMMSAGSPSSSNAMEMSLVLSQVLTLQQQIITSQQDLTSRIINLETRASQQFIGLAKQVQNLSAVRLTPERERKQIDFNQNSENYEN